ncbi:MarR family transcriptional regulator, partial [Lactobacillus salivarius]|nr:MarR family transcriptional regulator [Ligilactobacillus salivarius]
SGESLNYKVSFDQFLIMYEISTNENLTGSKLAKTMSVSRSAISRQCRLLKENGYVVEEHLQSDQRVKFLSLTKQGQDVLNR